MIVNLEDLVLTRDDDLQSLIFSISPFFSCLWENAILDRSDASSILTQSRRSQFSPIFIKFYLTTKQFQMIWNKQ